MADNRFQFDRPLCNVLILSFSFMGVFVAFQTASLTEVVVLRSWNDTSNETGVYVTAEEGYWSLATIYTTFTLANWIAPSIVETVGVKISLIGSALCYALFIAMFYHPLTWIVYTCSAILGIAAAVLWTAQGKCLTVNSNEQNISRNASLFWMINMSALVWGNLFVYFRFQGATVISSETRTVLTTVLLVVCLCGIALMLFLRTGSSYAAASSDVSTIQPYDVFLQSVRLFATYEMLLFMPIFAYTGLVQSMFSVLLTSIGSTEQFGTQAKGLVGIGGVMIGVGEIVAGLLIGQLLRALLKWRAGVVYRRRAGTTMGESQQELHAPDISIVQPPAVGMRRDAIVLLGAVIQLVCFFLMYANLPNRAPLGGTHDRPAIFQTPSIAVAVISAFLIGFGDYCWQTQIMETLSTRYAKQSAPAFALFKFAQSAASAIVFVYSSEIMLQPQLLIISIVCTIAALAFFVIDRRIRSISTELTLNSAISDSTNNMLDGDFSDSTMESGNSIRNPNIRSDHHRRGKDSSEHRLLHDYHSDDD